MSSSPIKSGFVGVLGQTNVGKSTLINSLLGQKLLIVSEKRQSTRNRIRCIFNDQESQIIFMDTPGLHKPVDRLSKFLVKQALGIVDGIDLILYLIEPWVKVQPYDASIFEELGRSNTPKFLVINKIDQAKESDILETIHNYSALGLFAEYIPISCKKGLNLDRLIHLIKEQLTMGPRYFPEGATLDRPESFIIAEFIREKIYALTHEEIPYSVFVEVVDIRERTEKPLVEVYANIHVARESQKGILVGSGGAMIREIGKLARKEIENLLGVQVYLDLNVKVSEKWNENEQEIIKALGGPE